MKPVGSSGTSEGAEEETVAASSVATRCFRHQAAQPRRAGSQRGFVVRAFSSAA
jgi:hypothetical protein